MSKRTVAITVSPRGDISIEAVAFKGADCEQATRYLEEALGTVGQKTKKPEYYTSEPAGPTSRGWEDNVMDVLTIKPCGMICGLYTEIIPLHELGLLKINRLTEIEFNGVSQQWEARDRAGTLLFTDPSRQRCLEWEHQRFN